MSTNRPDPYCAFQDDQCRLEALYSRHERDKSIAKVKAVAVVAVCVALIFAGRADSVVTWLAGMGAGLARWLLH